MDGWMVHHGWVGAPGAFYMRLDVQVRLSTALEINSVFIMASQLEGLIIRPS